MTPILPACSVCGCNLLQSGEGLFCFRCQVLRGVPKTRTTPKTEPRETSDSEFKNEAELVEAIRRVLESRGWAVYRIGQHRADLSGTDAGVPDLWCIYPPQHPYPAIEKRLEVKFGYNQPTAEQQKLIDWGVSVAVWSVKEALRAVGELE
jgi:hypothetical protein